MARNTASARGAFREPVRAWLLGGFRVSVGARVVEWRGRRPESLVKMLALAGGRRMHREEIISRLWPDLDPKRASNNLHRTLHFARKALHPADIPLRDGFASLCPDSPLRVDVEAFEEAAEAARQSRDTSAYRRAVELYAGDLLPEDRYEAWAEGRRRELKTLHAALLTEMASLHEERGEFDAAIEALEKAAGNERDDVAARTSGRTATGRGRTASGLSEGIGARFGGEAERTIAGLRTGGVPSVRAPSGGAEANHNLPSAYSSFVGRRRETVEVKRSLAMTRLLTLTGAGGCGKTRLAVEVARGLVGAYEDGVWLVEFAPLSDATLVPRAVAAALGVRERPGRSLMDTLSEHLRAKNTLLVMDNCEHLVEEAASLADDLLRSCGKLRVLATSREPLGVPGEAVWPVPPLSLPDGEASAGEMMESEAVRLFVERARSRLRDFELVERNAASVARVCRRLDGIPLAIELATARMGALAVEIVAERLEESLEILGGTSRRPEPRHRTMRATIAWSHDLLDEGERALFRRLSVFAGGWTMEAAEEVCEGDGVERGDVLDLLSRLVEKSLVVVASPTAEASDGAIRYRMLEPVRKYAGELLEGSGEGERVRERHVRYFLAFAEDGDEGAAERVVIEGRPEGWRERMEGEHANFSAALSWSLDGGRRVVEVGMRLAVALFWLWHLRQIEGRKHLRRAAYLGGPETAGLRARALHGLSWITLFQGGHDEARALIEESVALYREAGDAEALASGLVQFGMARVIGQREDVPLAAIIREVEDLKPDIENRSTLGYLLILEGLAAFGGGDLERARELHEESLGLFREARDAAGAASCMLHLGAIALIKGDHDRVVSLARGALRERRDEDDATLIQLWLVCLGCAALDTGHPRRGIRSWGAADRLRITHGVHLSPVALHVSDYEARLASARSRLGEEAFAAAWTEGGTMPMNLAIEHALSEKDDSPSPRTTGPPHILTPRQSEVASLVGKGLSNREISEELHLSEHTVMAHLRDIRKKLGVKSRAGIAAWFFEESRK